MATPIVPSTEAIQGHDLESTTSPRANIRKRLNALIPWDTITFALWVPLALIPLIAFLWATFIGVVALGGTIVSLIRNQAPPGGHPVPDAKFEYISCLLAVVFFLLILAGGFCLGGPCLEGTLASIFTAVASLFFLIPACLGLSGIILRGAFAVQNVAIGYVVLNYIAGLLTLTVSVFVVLITLACCIGWK
ncbi:hypothetical protein DL96DRAFT_1635712 [Flagelloscypha sp. PMI_526]|nr:hypothetical protein DL96DRAFT_1635712 [Flagelloscypha sp. PMI_526]